MLLQGEVADRLISFIRDEFLYGDPACEFSVDSLLLDSGILDSLNTAILLNFVETEWGEVVPVEKIDPRAFESVGTLAAMLCDVAGDAP